MVARQKTLLKEFFETKKTSPKRTATDEHASTSSKKQRSSSIPHAQGSREDDVIDISGSDEEEHVFHCDHYYHHHHHSAGSTMDDTSQEVIDLLSDDEDGADQIDKVAKVKASSKQAGSRSGNTGAANTTEEEIARNNAYLTNFVGEHAQGEDGKTPIAFLIRTSDTVAAIGSSHTGRPICTVLTLGGLKERTYQRQRSGTTAATTAVRFPHLGLHKVSQEQDDCPPGYVLVQLVTRKNPSHSPEEVEAEYSELVAAHKPSPAKKGKPFWIREAGDTEELDAEHFDNDQHYVYNGHNWNGLTTKFRKAAAAGKKAGKTDNLLGIEKVKGMKKQSGYILVQLKIRATRT